SRRGPKQLDRVLAAVAPLLAHLIDQSRSARPPAPHVPLAQSRQHLLSHLPAHRHLLSRAGVIHFESTTFSTPPKPTLPSVKTFEATGRSLAAERRLDPAGG